MTSQRFLVVALGALAGCAGTPGGDSVAAPVPTPSTTAPATVDENLARLRALEVFEVGALMVDRPREAFACYGPCPGSEAAVAAAERTAAARLDRFTAAAEAATTAHPATVPGAPVECDLTGVDANLAALRALQVVEVGAFERVVPMNAQNPYSRPSAADTDTAGRTNCAHAAVLTDLVATTRTL